MRLLIAGGEGQLGREFPALASASVTPLCCARTAMDITSLDSVRATFSQLRPDAVINAAAYTAVDRAEQEETQAFAINADGPAHLATVAAEYGIPLLHVSTDYVFDGNKPRGEAWQEDETCHPQSAYGRSKRAGEERILAIHPGQSLIVRTSWVFGAHGHNFPKTMLRLGQERDEVRVVADQWGGPTPAVDIARMLVHAAAALQAGKVLPGIYHYAGQPFCSWFDLANAVFALARERGLRTPAHVTPISSEEYPVPARRPANSALDSRRLCAALGIDPPDWSIALRQVVAAWQAPA